MDVPSKENHEMCELGYIFRSTQMFLYTLRSCYKLTNTLATEINHKLAIGNRQKMSKEALYFIKQHQ